MKQLEKFFKEILILEITILKYFYLCSKLERVELKRIFFPKKSHGL